MAFNFRLEKVLKFRRRVVEQCTREVATANRVVEQIKSKLENLEADIHRMYEANAMELNLTLKVEELISRGHWLDHLEALHREVESELFTAEQEVAQLRLKLNEAWRDQEVLESLKRKQKAEWQEGQRKLENQELDEIGQIRADRQRREKVS